MIGSAMCEECHRSIEFEIPKEPVNPMHRRGVRAYFSELRRELGRRHRRMSGCKSSRFTATLHLLPVELSIVEDGRRVAR